MHRNQQDTVDFLNGGLSDLNQGQFNLAPDEVSIEFKLTDIPVTPGLEHARAMAPLARVQHPGTLAIDTPQMPMFYEAQRALTTHGLITSGDRDDIVASIELQNGEGSTLIDASFSVPLSRVNVRPVIEALTAGLPVAELSREDLLVLVDKERMAAFWDYRDFLAQHGATVADTAGRELALHARRGEVLVFSERELLRYLPGGDRGTGAEPDAEIVAAREQGRLPDKVKYFLGHTMMEQRAVVNGESYLVIQNEPINPFFPVGKTGTVERRDEVNNGLSVFLEHMNNLGASIDFSHAWRRTPGDVNGPTPRVIPDAEMGVALYASFLNPENIAQLNSHATSNFHIDVSRGISLTRFMVAGIDADTLAAPVTTDQLRVLLEEQRAEIERIESKVTAPEGTLEAQIQRSRAYREISKDRGSERHIGIGNLSDEGLRMALRSQFQGLLSESVSRNPVTMGRLGIPLAETAEFSLVAEK